MPISNKMRKKMEAKKEAIKSSQGNNDFHYLKPGVNRIRPVPLTEESDPLPEIITFFLDKESGTVISPATFNEPCPVMEKYEKLLKSGSEDDIELANKIKPKRRFVTYALKYEDEKGKNLIPGGPRLVLLPMSVGSQLIDFYTEDEDGYGDFTNAHNGYSLKIKKEGQGLNTEYSVLATPQSPCPKPWIKESIDISQKIKEAILPYTVLKDKLKTFLSGNLEDIPESVGKNGKSKKSKKPKKSDA